MSVRYTHTFVCIPHLYKLWIWIWIITMNNLIKMNWDLVGRMYIKNSHTVNMSEMQTGTKTYLHLRIYTSLTHTHIPRVGHPHIWFTVVKWCRTPNYKAQTHTPSRSFISACVMNLSLHRLMDQVLYGFKMWGSPLYKASALQSDPY